MTRVGVAIVTYNAEKHLQHCLKPIIDSPLKPKILIIDSSSKDKTVEIARSLGIEVVVIAKSEFNHGLTRDKARKHLDTEVVVMMTQDAYAVDAGFLEPLVEPILNKEASASYARQISHKGGGVFESFPREFNYPEKSHIRSLEDLSKWGSYLFFCSDSCAAYSNADLEAVGGFPHVLFGEDTVVVSKLLRNGKKIAYAADSVVHHSHAYTLKQEFKRHFDMGYARKKFQSLLAGGNDGQRGRDYVRALMARLKLECPELIPYAIIQCGAKWCGFRLGQASTNAPMWFKRLCSSQWEFWS